MVTYLNDIDSLSVYNGTAFTTDRTIQVFAGTAARGSAIPAPVEGMYSHLNDTDTLQYYDGSAWSDAGAGSGLVLIATQTVSGVTAINFNNCFSSLYTNYRLVASGSTVTRGTFRARLRVGGVDAAGSNYTNALFYRDSALLTSGYNTQTFQEVGVLETQSNMVTSDIARPFEVVQTAFLSDSVGIGGAGVSTWRFGGGHSLATSYDGISILPAFAFTGSISIYGYRI
jgi:hypothetical protein